MLIAGICRAGATPALFSALRAPVIPKQVVPRIQVSRLFGNRGRGTYRNSGKFSEPFGRFFASEGPTEFTTLKRVATVVSLVGLGALTMQGLTLKPVPGSIEHIRWWPEYVKQRVKATYMYFGSAIAVSVASAAVCLRTPTLMRLVSRQGLVAFIVTSAAMIGSGIMVHTLPYKEGLGAKQLAFFAHAALIGAIFAPLYILAGQVALRAAWYTAGGLTGFSLVALSAPHQEFIIMKGHLGAALGVLFATTIASAFLPPTNPAQLGLQTVIIWGGLILFTMFFAYDSQQLSKEAWNLPEYGGLRQFDPINHALSLFIDAVNIFMRIQLILSNSGSTTRR